MSDPLIHRLPEELLLHIFQRLESEPPSVLKSRREPSLQLTSAETHTYKDISQVSSRWRRIILPLLFRHSRIRLDIEPRTEWTDCPTCGRQAFGKPITAYFETDWTQTGRVHHIKLFKDAYYEMVIFEDASALNDPLRRSSLEWAGRFHHTLLDFLNFMQANNLGSYVQSLTVLTDRMLPQKFYGFPQDVARNRDFRYRAAAAFWQHLLSEIAPNRIAIVAPPADLACLTNCLINSHGDWAFEDMDFHILELRQEGVEQTDQTTLLPVQFSRDDLTQATHHGIADTSILRLRPWTHLSLNEGSFLKAYGTYEYFERGPPSLISSIKNFLSKGNHSETNMTALRSFTYTAIFPFSNHMDFRDFLPQLEELDVKLAPDPDSGILSDKNRVGKAQLEDCWQELFESCGLITEPFATFNMMPGRAPKLKKFVCRDVQIRAIRDRLDEEFTPLCLPVWAEVELGVFVRLAEVPIYPDADEYGHF